MLAVDDRSSRILYHGLRNDVDVVGILVEPRAPAMALLRRRVRRIGLGRTAGQVLFILVNKLWSAASRRKAARLMAQHGLDDSPFPSDLVEPVESVNSGPVAARLQQLAPDAVVVNGTRILSRDTLAAIGVPFLNGHMGMTPRYRGVHGGYWALASGDARHCGVTVHLMDEGIDTGGVIYQEPVAVGPGDDFNTYPVHQIAGIVPLMRMALRDVANGTLATRAGVGPSRIWSHPTLFEYLKNRLLNGVK